MPRPAVAGTGTSKSKQEWTPTPARPGRRDASGVAPDVASSPAVLPFLESLREELQADMAGAIETLTAGRTPGRLASPSAGMGRSGNRVLTGGGGGDDGRPDGSTSGDSRRYRLSRRSRRSYRCRRPRSFSSDASSRSDGETVRRTLVDFQIPVHKVGDNLLNTVADWHSYRLDNQNQTFTSRMRLRIAQDRKKLRVSIDRVRFDGTKTAEIFSFLRRFVRACNDSNVWKGKAFYLVGSFLTGAAATRFNKILPDTAGHIPGRTVASFPEAVHWLLVNYADSITLNQALSDVNHASLGAHEVPDAFAARLPDLKEVCGNVYGEDRLKMAIIQGLPKHLQVDAQQYNLQFTEHTLQQLASFTEGKHEQVKALQRLQPTPPKMYLARPSIRAGPRTPVLAENESSSQVGGRLEGWRGSVTPSAPRVTRGGERPNRVRACWLCNQEDHIAAACPEVPKELQDQLARQGIQFAKAVRWADRQAKGASPGRRDPKTVHNLRVAILQSIQENLYMESPEYWDSHPEEKNHDHGYLGIGKGEGGGAPVSALPSVPGPGDSVSASVAFLGRCGRRLRAKVASWTPCACRGTLLVLLKDNCKVKTSSSFGGEDPVSVAAVVDTGAGRSVVSEDLLPPDWRAHAWRVNYPHPDRGCLGAGSQGFRSSPPHPACT